MEEQARKVLRAGVPCSSVLKLGGEMAEREEWREDRVERKGDLHKSQAAKSPSPNTVGSPFNSAHDSRPHHAHARLFPTPDIYSWSYASMAKSFMPEELD